MGLSAEWAVDHFSPWFDVNRPTLDEVMQENFVPGDLDP